MTKTATNSESVRILRDKLVAISTSDDDRLDSEINRISRANAASGSFRSGKTIKEVERVCEGIIRDRAAVALSTIKDLPWLYTDNLESEP
jgi:hypothetical protein